MGCQRRKVSGLGSWLGFRLGHGSGWRRRERLGCHLLFNLDQARMNGLGAALEAFGKAFELILQALIVCRQHL